MDTTSVNTKLSIFCHGCYTIEEYRNRPISCKLCYSHLLEDVTNKAIRRPTEQTYTSPPNIVERTEPLIIQNNVIISQAKLEQKTTKVDHSFEPFTCTSTAVVEDDCSICLGTFNKADLIPLTSEIEPDQAIKWPKCGHSFHQKCMVAD